MIGKSVARTDGSLKVSGRARYSAEREEPGRPLYGFIVGAAIGSGRIEHIETVAAENTPGVRLVWTHSNACSICSTATTRTRSPRPDPAGPPRRRPDTN